MKHLSQMNTSFNEYSQVNYVTQIFQHHKFKYYTPITTDNATLTEPTIESIAK